MMMCCERGVIGVEAHIWSMLIKSVETEHRPLSQTTIELIIDSSFVVHLCAECIDQFRTHPHTHAHTFEGVRRPWL